MIIDIMSSYIAIVPFSYFPVTTIIISNGLYDIYKPIVLLLAENTILTILSLR